LQKEDRFGRKRFDPDERTVYGRLLQLQNFAGQIWPFDPTHLVCVLRHGHRTMTYNEGGLVGHLRLSAAWAASAHRKRTPKHTRRAQIATCRLLDGRLKA
jgi:hypothetical protein